MGKSKLFDLSGKVALVTAGGHGLGREYCIAVAKFGADVACNDIDIKLAQETVELVKKFGHRAIVIKADVSKMDEIERMVNQTVSEFSTIDILFCNAGVVNPMVPLHELSIEDWDKVMALNLRGTFLCMRTVLPIMIKQKRGSIISTASLAGLMCGITPHSAPYGASKGGVIGLTRHAAVAYARDGIRINAIAPGLHDTRPVGLNLTLEKSEELKRMIFPAIPMGRYGEPSEIQALAVYLASDASSYVTGQVFVQDGGISA